MYNELGSHDHTGGAVYMKCLIVVDYQVDFVSGSLGNAAAAALDAGIAARIRRARS